MLGDGRKNKNICQKNQQLVQRKEVKRNDSAIIKEKSKWKDGLKEWLFYEIEVKKCFSKLNFLKSNLKDFTATDQLKLLYRKFTFLSFFIDFYF